MQPATGKTQTVPSRRRLKDVLADQDSQATLLVVILIDKYGTEFLEWAPQTIRMQVHDDFQVELTDLNLSKVMAAAMLLTTDFFYKSLPRFISLCNTLAGEDVSPWVFDPADSFECAWGITEALLLSPPESREEEPFSEEIRLYIGEILKQEGYLKAPSILSLQIGLTPGENSPEDFSGDPELFSAIWQTQDSKASELDAMVRENLNDLITQLAELPLESGDTKALAERLASKARR